MMTQTHYSSLGGIKSFYPGIISGSSQLANLAEPRPPLPQPYTHVKVRILQSCLTPQQLGFPAGFPPVFSGLGSPSAVRSSALFIDCITVISKAAAYFPSKGNHAETLPSRENGGGGWKICQRISKAKNLLGGIIESLGGLPSPRNS